ncbi:MAG: cupin domain-containing protein [Acidobacteriaceae bacterium]
MPSHPVSPKPVNLELACSALSELWSPRVVGQVNNQYIKVARVQGEFPWHAHALEDEMFLVLRGELQIGRAKADGGNVVVRPGEFFVVPRGVRHNTSATEETWLALIETVSTEHTGGEQTPMTRSIAEQLAGVDGVPLTSLPESATKPSGT